MHVYVYKHVIASIAHRDLPDMRTLVRKPMYWIQMNL